MLWLKIAPWAGCVIFGWLLLEAREDVGEAREQGNTRVTEAARAAEQAVRERLSAVHAQEMAQVQNRLNVTLAALGAAEDAKRDALQGVEARDSRIRQLELEVFNAETLPDSRECLNVFMPADVVERMFWDESCDATGNSGSPGDEVCADTGGVSGPDAPDFALITFGDGARGWNHDRQSLRECVIDIRAIESLSNEATD